MNNEIKLRQRFCKDCDIPVNIFDEPYFSDRLKLFDFLYDSVSKWDLFKSELAKYDSAMDYFADYSRIKDEAIETVRNAEGFQLFTAYGINDFSIKNKGLPVNKIYKPENNGRVFLSIDMRKAKYKISGQVPYMNTEAFSLHKIYGYGVDGYIKNVYSMDNAGCSLKVKCVDKDMMAFVARYLLKEPITDSDRTFYCNGLLAKFEQVPEITTDMKSDNKAAS